MITQKARAAEQKNFITNNSAPVIFKKRFKRFFSAPHILFRIALFLLFFLFSSWLMFQTFSYDSSAHDIKIAFKLWSDFGAHLPLIRSFSMGDNFSNLIHFKPIQYPVFAGPPIRYHFLFDMLVGLMEKSGMRIDWALNIPSIAGFFGLMVLIYLLSVELFGVSAVGILSVLFFLFNGSFSFLRFFTAHPLSTNTIHDLTAIREFPAFAPWGPGEVTAFWNLNVYTNQRQLAPAFGIILLFVFMVVRSKRMSQRGQIVAGLLWGLVFALFPLFHQPSLLIIAVIFSSYFFLYPARRLFIFITGMVSGLFIVPQVLLTPTGTKAVEWYPGFIIHNDLIKQQLPAAMIHMAGFWWQNFGVHSILIVIGFFLIPKRARIALLSIIPIFIIPNLLKFSVEASANHKFFNFVLILGQMISAYMVVFIFRQCNHITKKLFSIPVQIVVVTGLIGVLTLSGVIDLFVVANDTKGSVSDIPKNEIATWIAQNTPKDAVFLNSSYLYHPASIAGRNIFLGWPYFAWSAGYQENRMPIMNVMFETKSTGKRCQILKKYNISYVTAEDVRNDTNLPDIDLTYFLKNYSPAFVSKDNRYAIFTIDALCPH